MEPPFHSLATTLDVHWALIAFAAWAAFAIVYRYIGAIVSLILALAFGADYLVGVALGPDTFSGNTLIFRMAIVPLALFIVAKAPHILFGSLMLFGDGVRAHDRDGDGD
ncbi:hypothetical protein [Alterisphingorhabdus coralli]|uniref:Uncharacterized protein n=1 Tax=Alterisphingorhabdus coralli TaxID=3071408 RepID=A0AA97I2T4_9SPHN|nr:hypothetical protein [Parasphingorhabdus sp. SCSIO 66989]WOE76755.1 hypothetical protein RB602_15325 [Parasphingorhabdus sp. SCSIO 66989]